MKNFSSLIASHRFGRRAFLRQGVSLAAGSAFSLMPPLNWLGCRREKGVTDLRLCISPDVTSTEVRAAAHAFAQDIFASSSGRIRVSVISDFDPNLDLIHCVRSEQIDICLHATASRREVPPGITYFGSLPNGLSREQKEQWLTSDAGSRLWAELYAEAGVRPLYFGCGNDSYGQICTRPLRKMADFQGLRVAVNDGRRAWFEKLGAIPVQIEKVEDVVQHLRRGTLELTEPAQHSLNHGDALYRLGRRYYVNDWFRTSYTYELLFPVRRWQALDHDTQSLLQSAAIREGRQLSARTVAREESALRKISETAMPVGPFPGEISTYFRRAACALRQQIAKGDPLARKIEDAYANFQPGLAV